MADETYPPSQATPQRPAQGLGRRILLIVFAVVAGLRLLLLVFSHSPKPHPHALPQWPVHAGDVLHFQPGDPAIATWAADPRNDGILVRQIERDGAPLQETKVCALELDYMADAAQPGGDLTLLSQDELGIWRVRWTGGETMPPDSRDSATCGRSAIIAMSGWQFHTLINIELKLPEPPHEGPLDDTIVPGEPVQVR